MRARSKWVAAMVATFGMLVPATSQAAWSPAATISSGGASEVNQSQIAVAADGTAYMVWTGYVEGVGRVRAASRAPGGAWSAPVELSAEGRPARAPHVAVGPDGTVHAVWERSNGLHNIVQATQLSPGASAWNAAEDLSAPGQHANDPFVAVGGDGTAHVMWTRSDGTHDRVQSTWRAAGGSWDPPENRSAAGEHARGVWITVAADGTAHAVWRRNLGGPPTSVVQTATRPAAGPWGTVKTLSLGGAEAGTARIAVDATGAVHAAWTRTAGTITTVQYALRSVDGVWGTVDDLLTSVPGRLLYGADVAVGGDGSVHVAWSAEVVGGEVVQSATRAPGGAWGAPTMLSTPGVFSNTVRLVASASGTVHATWSAYLVPDTAAQAAMRQAGGTWTTPVNLAVFPGGFEHSKLAISPDGTAHATWVVEETLSNRLYWARFDAAPPVVSNISVPATTSTDRAASMSATVLDVESGLAPGQPVWSFGDGTAPASGTAVTHAYAQPGTYTVALTATDVDGNVASVSRQIVVVAVAPTIGRTPTVTGTPRAGAFVTCSHAAWAGTAPVGLAYRWQIAASPRGVFRTVRGATARRYRVRAADRGARLRCIVTASNVAGQSTRIAPARLVPVPPRLHARLTLTGATRPGAALACATGRWTGSAPLRRTVRWQRQSGGLSPWRTIPRQATTRYVVRRADAGTRIRCTVTVSNGGGSTTVATRSVTIRRS